MTLYITSHMKWKIEIKLKLTNRSNNNVFFEVSWTRVLSWGNWTSICFSCFDSWYKCWLQSQFGCLGSTAPSWLPIFNNIVCSVVSRNIISFRVYPLYISCTIKSSNITWYDLIFTSSYTSVMRSDSWKDRRISIIIIGKKLNILQSSK